MCHLDAGGGFARRLRAAGLLAIFIEGKSPRPVALVVTPAGGEIVPADGLWGKSAPETVAALSGHGGVAAIGPAGENGVLFANVLVDEGNAAGRGGLGAVMGSKRLKAVAVDGDLPVPVADPGRSNGPARTCCACSAPLPRSSGRWASASTEPQPSWT